MDRELLKTYATASGGDVEAYAWLLAWHGWCHELDDDVDDPARDRLNVVDRGAEAAVLFAAPFWRRHSEALGPMVGVIAAKYRSSVLAERDGRQRLSDALRIAGNDMVLAVAYLRGGTDLARRVAESLWPIVERDQLSAA